MALSFLLQLHEGSLLSRNLDKLVINNRIITRHPVEEVHVIGRKTTEAVFIIPLRVNTQRLGQFNDIDIYQTDAAHGERAAPDPLVARTKVVQNNGNRKSDVQGKRVAVRVELG